MDLAQLSDADLQEWREHPITALLSKCLKVSHSAQRQAATSAYWAGTPWPEEERLSLMKAEALWEDLFEVSADELRDAMERMNE